jgi:tRNA-binding protein
MAERAAASVEAFNSLDIRVGTVVRCEGFPEARKPAYKLWIDFGPEVGVKASSARITDLYVAEELIGRQVLAVVNFPPRRIGPFTSEVLTLGVYASEETVVLVIPERPVPNGSVFG